MITFTGNVGSPPNIVKVDRTLVRKFQEVKEGRIPIASYEDILILIGFPGSIPSETVVLVEYNLANGTKELIATLEDNAELLSEINKLSGSVFDILTTSIRTRV